MKIKVQRQLEGRVSIRAIFEATVSQNEPSSQKSTINEWSVSQCRISSRVTVSLIKVLSGMAMRVGSSHNS